MNGRFILVAFLQTVLIEILPLLLMKSNQLVFRVKVEPALSPF